MLAAPFYIFSSPPPFKVKGLRLCILGDFYI
jgi:hypothetical protein